MDRLEALGNALSQVSVYDIKSYYNQAKNMVLNVTEMEAKVREATNDEPWGASSTLMQEIAQGTFNFQQFNEIMPCIYSRFMDKEARQWREIYKALQLLEYIIKHGSERVVDDARSHLSTIKILRNFHYIDEKGKDQGINVRNRAKELSELLMDVDRIRTERRKAKTNRNKYVGTGNDSMSFGGGGGRYGGFGSDGGSRYGSGGGGYDRDYGGYSGGGSGSGSGSGFRDDSNRRFDEYNAGDDEVPPPRRSNSLASPTTTRTSAATTSMSTSAQNTAAAAKSKAKEVDLLGFMDDDFGAPVSAAPAPAVKPAEKALPALVPAANPLDDGDDDFADFQAAPTSAPVAQAPPMVPIAPISPTSPPVNANAGGLFDVLGGGALAPQQAQRPAQPGQGMFGGFSSPLQPLSPSSGGFVTTSPPPMGGIGMGGAMRPTPNASASFSSVKSGAGHAKTASSAGGGFDDLWSMSLGAGKTPSGGASAAGTGKSIRDLEKEKAQAGIWGGGSSAGGFGAFGSGTTSNTGGSSAPAASGGLDDLLL